MTEIESVNSSALHSEPTTSGISENDNKISHYDFTKYSKLNDVQYLGCSQLRNSNDDHEIKSLMKEMDEQRGSNPVRVTITVPHFLRGHVQLIDSTDSVLLGLPVVRIRLIVRGERDTTQSNCFAVSVTEDRKSPDGDEKIYSHQCHVFKATQETAGRAFYYFTYALSSKLPHDNIKRFEFGFRSILQIWENDGINQTVVWKRCPLYKGAYKMRRDRAKKLVIQLKQTSGFPLTIRKCFGMLLAAGRNLRQSDLQLLEMEKTEMGPGPMDFTITANWDPRESSFEVLNTETPRDTRVFLTVAIDVILTEVAEPVRFSIEAMSRVFHEHERFVHHPNAMQVEEGFTLVLEKEEDQDTETRLSLISLESESEKKRSLQNLGRSPSRMPTQLLHPTGEDESDSDEPLLSGSGSVSQDCGEEVLAKWNECITEWIEDPERKRPEKVTSLILSGIPDAIRGKVWQLLSGSYEWKELAEKYSELLIKDSPSEQTIMRDIHRTFPAHDHFKTSGGEGQTSLYRISKVYSLYDEEVSYCQGLSFLAASLLLHMPEEEAFGVLVKIMFDYGLRDLFKLGFDNLHLRFYQLTSLLRDYLPDLYAHLDKIGIETHMYASQWFLTLFTAKFPLQMVFFILDLFLSQGMNTIFHISLALLQDAKNDLLQLDFEGTLKYFRVSLPRKYRTEASTKALILKAVNFKINHTRLEKYEADYIEIKKNERENEDPVKFLEKENIKHVNDVMRLERENEDLARELVTSKIELRKKLDLYEDQIETQSNTIARLTSTIERLTAQHLDVQSENKSLLEEYQKIQKLYRDDVLPAEKLAEEYKNMYRRMDEEHEQERKRFQKQKKAIVARIQECDHCWPAVQEWEQKRSPTREGQMNVPDLLAELKEREDEVKHLEGKLVEKTVELVEVQNRNEELMQQIRPMHQNDAGPKWLQKTITSLKVVGSSLKHERSNSSVAL